jgi:HPt (histidine-containing phosphotransfer) domain-containing protein
LPIPILAAPAQTGIVETTLVLDRAQLREVALEDEDLMRELLAALLADTEQQIPLLDLAIRRSDLKQCASLAHYCKGACANVGAKAAATVLADLERSAKSGAAEECGRQLAALAMEVDRLRAERV